MFLSWFLMRFVDYKSTSWKMPIIYLLWALENCELEHCSKIKEMIHIELLFFQLFHLLLDFVKFMNVLFMFFEVFSAILDEFFIILFAALEKYILNILRKHFLNDYSESLIFNFQISMERNTKLFRICVKQSSECWFKDMLRFLFFAYFCNLSR